MVLMKNFLLTIRVSDVNLGLRTGSVITTTTGEIPGGHMAAKKKATKKAAKKTTKKATKKVAKKKK